MALCARTAPLLFLLAFNIAVAQSVTGKKAEEFQVGVVLDLGTLVGKVASTSISLAVEDFYAVHPNYTTQLVLHFRDSMGDDVQAASDLNIVIWPGEVTELPRGWELPVQGKKLQVGVVKGHYPEYIDADKDPITGVTTARGLAIDVFEEAVKRLPYALPYEYKMFNITGTESSSYDEFVYQVYLKKYHIAIGDISIRYNRSLYVDFTLPYTESGIAMEVPVKESTNKDAWIFLKPLTPDMWFATIILFIYTGFVIWLLELLGNNKNAPISRQLVTSIYLSMFEES